MIIAGDKGHTLEGVGLGSTSQFRIKASYKAFELLGDKLYSDKIGSIIRELSANALDAHRLVGKADVPFELYLPTTLRPTFAIRDFGPGLSDEAIKNVYTTYFESTKTESNDFIGAFGLGSKTPFAYTNMFTVISRHGGMKRIYSAHMTNDGPALTLLSEGECDEPCGLEVSFPVRLEDQREFEVKAGEQLRYFTVKPTIYSENEVPFEKVEKKFEGEGWYAVENSHYDGYHSWHRMNNPKIVALLDQVGYTIDLRQVYGPETPKEIALFGELPLTYYVRMPIGSMNVSVSREALSYDEHTITSIKEFLPRIAPQISAEVKKYVETQKKDFTDLWEAMIAAIEWRNGYRGALRTYMAHVGINNIYTFNGKPLPEKQTIELMTPTVEAHYKTLGDDKIKELKKMSAYKGAQEVYKLTGFIVGFIARDTPYYENDRVGWIPNFRYSSHFGRTTSSTTHGGCIVPSKTVRVLLWDTQKATVKALSHWAGRRNIQLIVIRSKEQKDIDSFLKEIHYTGEVLKASEQLEDILEIASESREDKNNSGGTYVSLYEWRFRATHSAFCSAWESLHYGVTERLNRGGLYVPVSSHKPIVPDEWKDKFETPDQLNEFIQLVKKCDPNKHDIFGVGKLSLAHVEKNDKWVNIFDYAKKLLSENPEMLKKAAKLSGIIHHFQTDNDLRRAVNKFICSWREDKKDTETLANITNQKLRETLMEGYAYYSNKYRNDESLPWAELQLFIGEKPKAKKKAAYLTKAEIDTAYPLFDIVSFGSTRPFGTAKWAPVVEYVNLVETAKMANKE